MIKDGIKYGIKCTKCGTRLYSTHTHDFKYCKCGAIFIDGGDDYMRYGGDANAIKPIKKKVNK